MRYCCGAVLALVVAAAAWADPPKLDIPAEVKAPAAGYLTLKPKSDAASVVYVAPNLDPFPAEFLADKTVLLVPVRGLAAGSYPCWAVAASKTGEQAVVQFTVVVGTPTPGPGPGPGPTPGPDPFSAKAGADPFCPTGQCGVGAAGLKVLIVEDAAARPKLSVGQNDTLFGSAVRTHLFANATGGWGLWSKDDDVSRAPVPFQHAFAYAKAHATAYPYIVASNGVRWTAGPIPAGITPGAFIDKLKPYEVQP